MVWREIKIKLGEEIENARGDIFNEKTSLRKYKGHWPPYQWVGLVCLKTNKKARVAGVRESQWEKEKRGLEREWARTVQGLLGHCKWFGFTEWDMIGPTQSRIQQIGSTILEKQLQQESKGLEIFFFHPIKSISRQLT